MKKYYGDHWLSDRPYFPPEMIPKDSQTWNLSTWRIEPFAEKKGLIDSFLILLSWPINFKVRSAGSSVAAASFIPLALDPLILPSVVLHPGFRLCPSFFAAATCGSYSASSRFVPICSHRCTPCIPSFLIKLGLIFDKAHPPTKPSLHKTLLC